MTIKYQLKALIEQSKKLRSINQYIENDKLVAYIRITKRYIEGNIVETIDIANIQVFEEYSGKGVFKKFLETVESIAKENGKTVYIESVLNPVLIDKLPEYGYKKINHSYPPCFQK